MTTETDSDYSRTCFLLTRYFLRVATRVYAAILLVALSLAVLLLPSSASANTPEWLLFIGRFHPLVLHLPIALIVLIPLLHGLARVCPPGTLRPAIALTLWLCAGSALGAAVCGLLLSQESGYAGATLDLHRRSAIVLTVFSVALLVLESESANPSVRRVKFARSSRNAYRAVVPLTLLALTVAAHLGASLTHGSTFLTEHLPPKFKAWAGLSAPPKSPSAGNAYTSVVAPILEARCVSCHGTEKAKGGLRLHTLDAIMAGGDSQRDEGRAAVVPRHAEQSLLISAVCAAIDDDAHMPPSGKPQLTSAEITSLRAWIDSGANTNAPAPQIAGSASSRQPSPVSRNE